MIDYETCAAESNRYGWFVYLLNSRKAYMVISFWGAYEINEFYRIVEGG